MALSGTIYGTTSNQYIDVKIEWSATQSQGDNSSTITARIYYKRNNTGYETHGNWRGEITIDGSSTSIVKEVWINENGWEEAGKATKTVAHNADGTKSTTISATGKINNTSLDSTSISGTITLNPIIRSITLNSATNFTDEGNPTITYSNPAGSSALSLEAAISFDKTAVNIPYRSISKTSSTYTFNFTTNERNIIRNYFKNTNSGTVYFFIKANLGGTNYYSSLAKTVTIVNANPTLNPTAEDINPTTLALTGDKNKFIKYYSEASVAANAAAVKSATLNTVRVACGAKAVNSQTGILKNVEDARFVYTAIDSRGNSTSQTLEKTLVDYCKLTCNLTIVPPSTEGNMSFTISGNYFNRSFGIANNALSLEIRFKQGEGAFSEWVKADYTLSGDTYSSTYSLSNLDYQQHYTFQARAADKLSSITTPETSITGTPVFAWGETEFEFNVPVSFNKDYVIEEVSGKQIAAAAKALSTNYSLPTTGVPAGGYSSFTVSDAVLMGGNLRCYFTATRSTQFTDGNMANELVGSITIQHGGKIASMYNVSFCSGGGGVLASLQTTNAANSDTTLTFDVQLASIGSTGNSVNSYFIVPVSLNLDAY